MSTVVMLGQTSAAVVQTSATPSYVVTQGSGGSRTVSRVVQSRGSVFLATPTSPTLTNEAINELSNYPNTEVVQTLVNTAFTNAISFVEANYTNTASLQISLLNDVVTTNKTNNNTLVFDAAQNKFVSKSLNLDGGTF